MVNYFYYNIGSLIFFNSELREVISRLVSEKDNKKYYLLSGYGPPVLEADLIGTGVINNEISQLHNEPLQC